VSGAEDWLAGGRVGRPHGLDGSFHVVAARPALLVLGAAVRAGDRETEIVRRAGTDERPIVRLAGVEDRDAAEALRGLELLVPRAVAPPLEDDEWWAEDLEGCRVVDGERELGRVARLVPLPSCEALEVSGAAEEFLVPLVRDAVRSVDVEARLIDVDVAFLGDTAPAFARSAPEAGGASGPAGPRAPHEPAPVRAAGEPAAGESEPDSARAAYEPAPESPRAPDDPAPESPRAPDGPTPDPTAGPAR
jgi:16S rRNA processing protein RimM